MDWILAVVIVVAAAIFIPMFKKCGRTRKVSGKIQSSPIQGFNNSIAYYLSASSKIDDGDYNGAIEDFSMAITISPDFVEAYYNRGLTRAKFEEYSLALADFNKAIELSKNEADASIYFARSMVRKAQSDTQGAIDDLDSAIETKEDYAEAYLLRSELKKDFLKDAAGAKEDYDKAVELDSSLARRQKT